jgi:hypothetical protein
MYNIDFHMNYFMYIFVFCLLSAFTNLPKYIRKAIVHKYGLNNSLFIEQIVEPLIETTVESKVETVVEKYEDKYLTKFKSFTSEYFFTEEELSSEPEKLVQLMCEFEKKLNQDLDNIKHKICKIESIIELWPSGDGFINKLTKYFDIKDEYNDDPDDYDVEELYNDLKNDYTKYQNELKKIEQTDIPEQELKDQAHLYVIDKKLDGYINNYVLETTPLGNIYMRYNHNKKSFEYFSNNTIPYRYLETVCRKYVMTYRCKALFVDIEEELNKAQIKDDELKKETELKKENELKKEKDNHHPKNLLANFKSYNKETKKEQNVPTNKGNKSSLPPQMKVNLPILNTKGEKQLLKENANRYTWEGRVANLSLLKSVDRKMVDKNYALSFADFKQMQQNKR